MAASRLQLNRKKVIRKTPEYFRLFTLLKLFHMTHLQVRVPLDLPVFGFQTGMYAKRKEYAPTR